MTNKDEIILEKGKEYLVYIASNPLSSLQIVRLLSKYNPLFICATHTLDLPKNSMVFERKDDWKKSLIDSQEVKDLFIKLQKHQNDIPVKFWGNKIQFQDFFEENPIHCLGISPREAHQLNNKIYQYKLLEDVIRLPKFLIRNKESAEKEFDSIKTKHGVYTTSAYGGQGCNSKIHKTQNDFIQFLEKASSEDFIVAEALDTKISLSMEILVANEKEYFAFALSEQIMDKFSSIGAVYPARVSKEVEGKCQEFAEKIAQKLATEDYRGIFSIDFMVDKDDQVYFTEINGRYSSTTGFKILAVEGSKPKEVPSILDLEMMAIKEKTLNGFKMWKEPKDVFWWKMEIYVKEDSFVQKLSIENDIHTLFQKKNGIGIVAQVQEGKKVLKGKSALGNIVVVADSAKKRDELITEAKNILKIYIKAAK